MKFCNIYTNKKNQGYHLNEFDFFNDFMIITCKMIKKSDIGGELTVSFEQELSIQFYEKLTINSIM